MNVDEFRADLEAEVRNDALSFGHGTAATFAEKITALMSEAEQLNGDYQEAYFEGVHPRDRRVNLRVDGFLQDATDNSIALFVVHYTDGNENMTRTTAEKFFKLLESFANAVLTTNLEIEESTATFELAEALKANRGEKIKFILLTNARRSAVLRDIKKFSVGGREVDCQIWDIERIFNAYNSLRVREPIRIDFKKYGDGVPCLKATNADDECESFLCVMPGKMLADIYDEYGSRLLEGNVRSFLSTKRAVNKEIRKTILNHPEKFFAFNNGIAVTATKIELQPSANGLFLASAVDFQIINGGQTTALLSNARFKDKANLEKIFVQMKLTLIGDMPADKREVLIGTIARSSNSQNKISDADFFSTHPFHVEMEKISRRMPAPPQRGVHYQTWWFYERARGQYVQEQMKKTPAQKKAFQRENPKEHVMTKTDFAKYRMSWQEHPNIVSKGAQANFAEFAKETDAAWKQAPTQFNDYYFKETAALAIIFQAVDNMVRKQSWYNSYKANIVTYSLAIFHHALKKKFPDAELNLLAIWQAQQMPPDFEEIFKAITFDVNNAITDKSRSVTNVTQWCKQSLCWEQMKTSLRVELPENFSRHMIDKKSLKSIKQGSAKIQKASFEVDAQSKILSFSGAMWRKIYDDASARKLIALPEERSALSAAMKIPQRTVQPFQCKILLRLLDRLEENGLTYDSNADFSDS